MPQESDSKREWNRRDGVSSFTQFEVGDTIHGIPYGQGIGEVLAFDRAEDGQWTRVRVRYVSGCIPSSDGQLPRDTRWITRDELAERWSPEHGGGQG